jgi:hypothetical protein
MYSMKRHKENGMHRFPSLRENRSESQHREDMEVSSHFIESHQFTITNTHCVYDKLSLEREFTKLGNQDANKLRVVAIVANRQRTHHPLTSTMEERFGLDQRRDGKHPLLGSLRVRTWDVTIHQHDFLVFEELGPQPSAFQRLHPTFVPFNEHGISIMTHVITAILLRMHFESPTEEDTNEYTPKVTTYRAPSPTEVEKARDYALGLKRLFPSIEEPEEDPKLVWQTYSVPWKDVSHTRSAVSDNLY